MLPSSIYDIKTAKDKPLISTINVQIRNLMRNCRMSFVLLAVGVLQLVFLYIETQGGLSAGGFRACRETTCKQVIPKIIHQTYKTDKLPENWAETPQTWKDQHTGWTYEFWTDERNYNFIKENYPDFLPTYESYPYGIQRSDAVRYFILHHYGGVYADLDIQPKPGRSVSEIIGDAELVLPQTPNFGITNAFMASVNGSEFMEFVIKQLPSHANKWYQVVRHWHIMTSAGPTFLWAQYSAWKGDKTKSLVVPAGYWGKCSICKSRCRSVETSPLQHLTGNSWFSIDSFIFNYVIMCNPLPLAVTIVFIVELTMYLSAGKTEKVPKPDTKFFVAKWIALFALAAVIAYWKQKP